MNPNICFLIYLARSGSTLLASELDQYESIGVTLEENLPDGIKKGEPLKIENNEDLENCLNKIYRDEKFQAWGIDKTKLRNLLLKYSRFPLQYRDILINVYSLYFENTHPETVIHKQGNYALLIDKVRTEFPEALFLFVDRDPRAIHNSQIRYGKSTSGKLMNPGIVKFALTYKRMQNLIGHYMYEPFFYRVNYEDLIENKSEVLRRIIDFLGINTSKKKEKESYYSRIPEQQRHLHQNIQESYHLFRTTGWKEEMDSHRIVFLQVALRKELLDKNFEHYQPGRLSVLQKMIFIYWLIQYLLIYNLLILTNWNYFSLKKGRFRKFGCG